MERPPDSLPVSEQVQVAQAAGVISLGNIASRVLGMVWVIVKSGLFGAGPHVSALDAALRVPTALYDLLVGGLIGSALVPVFSDHASPDRRTELWQLLSILISMISCVGCLLLLLGELFAGPVIWVMAGGLSAPAQVLATQLLRLVLPAILFLNVAGTLTGALYALKRFTFPAFTAAVFNAAVVIVTLVTGRQWGVRSMAVGVVVGALLQVALQVPGLRDAGLRLSLDPGHPALRRIGRLYLPVLIGLVVDKLLGETLSYNLASRVHDSAISWMVFAAQIIQFPLGLIASALSIATLPSLSRHASADDVDPFRATLAQGLRLLLTLVIPATVGIYLLADPIVALVFEHGEFTPADTVAVAQAARYGLLGLPFAAVDQLLIVAFYARKDTMTPALVGVGTTILSALAGLTLSWLGVLTLPLLILINSLKWAAHALTMLVLIRRRLGGLEEHGLWSLTLKTAVSSLVVGGVAWSVARALGVVAPPGLAGEILIVGGSAGVGVLVYGFLAFALQVREISLLRHAIADALKRLTRPAHRAIISPPDEAGQE